MWIQKDNNGNQLQSFGENCPSSYTDLNGISYSGLPGNWTTEELNAIGLYQIADPVAVAPTPTPVTWTIAQQQQKLFAAYNQYIAQYVSGVGVGLLALGVAQQKTNSLAMAGWCKTVTTDYQTRKALVTQDSTTLPSLDFSNNGAPSVTIWQVEQEVLG